VTGVLVNTGSSVICALHATVTPVPQGLHAKLRHLPRRLGPHAAKTFAIELHSSTALTDKATVNLLMTYFARGSGGGVVTKSVTVAPTKPETLDQLVHITLGSAATPVRSGQSAKLLALVTNDAPSPVEVEGATGEGPKFVTISDGLPHGKTRTHVPAGGTGVVPLTVKASERVETGTERLVVALPVSAGSQHVTLRAEHDLDVSVGGASELLTILGVPSLLLIPGFIVLGISAALWQLRWWRPAWDQDDYPFAPNTPQFWVLAVTVSLLIVAAWSLVEDPSPFMGEYGVGDVVKIWLISLVVGAIAHAAALNGRNYRANRRMPREGDEPIATLQKLARRGLSVRRPRVQFSGSAYLQLTPEQEGKTAWIATRIMYAWKPGASDELEKQLKREIATSGNPKKVATLLKNAKLSQKIDVQWKDGRTPFPVKEDALTPEPTSDEPLVIDAT
jgi:hypothetical protein